MAISTLGEAIDLDRYPIDDLDGEAGEALLTHVRGELARIGACDLPGFVRPAALAAILDGLDEDLAYRMEQTHDIEFSGRVPASMAADDPLRAQVRSAKGAIAYDQVAAGSPLRAVYESDALTRFVGAAVGVEPLYRHADPTGALNVMVHRPGDELGWHFDNADFVVTLMLRPAVAGGVFEFAPMLRSPADANPAGVRALLAGDRTRVRTISAAAGTLALFRGHLSPHRVTPVDHGPARINAVLSYAATPDARLTASALKIFYGRE
jgi:hypothetical protein